MMSPRKSEEVLTILTKGFVEVLKDKVLTGQSGNGADTMVCTLGGLLLVLSQGDRAGTVMGLEAATAMFNAMSEKLHGDDHEPINILFVKDSTPKGEG